MPHGIMRCGRTLAFSRGGNMTSGNVRNPVLGPFRALLLGCFLALCFGTSLQADDWTPATSEEDGAASPAQCASGLVSGLRCTGRYCDNMALKCSSGQALGERSWSPYFSEEGNSAFVCPD